jgi:D-aminopeptidase
MDGDLIFGVSTNDIPPRTSITDTIELENTASICMARAIARAVFSATSSSRDKLPIWGNKYGI